ncbi:MAG: SemiSWEET transporter [Bacteroidota bacterium]
MEFNTEIIGLVAGTLTTISFLPQMIKTWRTRDAGDLSMGMFAIYFTGVCLWLTYGIAIDKPAIMLPNAISVLFAGIMLYFKLKFKGRPEPAENESAKANAGV